MPVDRGAIDEQLREIGEGDRWWEQREFRDLPHVLHADERIRCVLTGQLLGRRRPRFRSGAPWLLVATTERLICLRQERFARRQIDFAGGQVTRIALGSRLRGYQIALQTAQRTYRIRIAKEDAARFVAALAPLMPQHLARQVSPEIGAPVYPGIEQFGWIPGIDTVTRIPGVAGVVSRIAMLSPPDYASRAQVERLEDTVAGLQAEVERLQQQVRFIEDLLQKRAEEGLLQSGERMT